MELNEILNGDLLIFSTSDGLDKLYKVMDDPEQDDFLAILKKGGGPTPEYINKTECHHIMKFLTSENYDLVKWCRANDFSRNILDFNHMDIFKKIIKHMEDAGNTGRVDLRECYNLSYRPYMNAIYVLRNMYSTSRKFLRIAKKYKDISKIGERYIQWLPIWDNTLVEFERRDREKKLFIMKDDILENSEYLLHVRNKTLFPSLILWTFVSRNWEEICSNRWQKGEIFEKKLEIELKERDVEILYKNYEISADDEVDIICQKNDIFFMIEAKNYGPKWNNSYMDSGSFKSRIDELNNRIQLLLRARNCSTLVSFKSPAP